MPKRSRSSSPISQLFPDQQSNPESPEVTHTVKYIHTGGTKTLATQSMKCSLPPHSETVLFDAFEDFEIHYKKAHTNRCHECQRNLPSEHFLELHIEENHDPIVAAKKAKGEKTYRCFVEDCVKVCADDKKRRMHLIDKHIFPRNYDFHVVDTGIDRKSSMLRSKPHKINNGSSRTVEPNQGRPSQEQQLHDSPETILSHTPTDDASKTKDRTPSSGDHSVSNPDIDDLTSSLSALRFVPTSVRFGRRGRPKGFSKT